MSIRKGLRMMVASASVAATVAASVTPALASPPSYAPPGCTGNWNTTQSATNNQAPGTAPGCATAMQHA